MCHVLELAVKWNPLSEVWKRLIIKLYTTRNNLMAFLYYDHKVCSATGYVRVLRISQLLWKLRFLIKSAVQELTHTNTIEDGHQLKLLQCLCFTATHSTAVYPAIIFAVINFIQFVQLFQTHYMRRVSFCE